MVGTIYVLHFDRPLTHARHYIGWTERDDLDARLDEHRAGRGARIVEALVAAGIGFRVAATYLGTRHDERRMKRQKHGGRFCPECAFRERTTDRLRRLAARGLVDAEALRAAPLVVGVTSAS